MYQIHLTELQGKLKNGKCKRNIEDMGIRR